MTTLADPSPARVTREQYFALVDQGVLTEDDVSVAVDDLLP
jgi:hypothetical protein